MKKWVPFHIREQTCAAIFFALLLSSIPVSAQEDYSTWADSSDIYLNTSPNGANIANDVAHFPVLIRLRDGDFPFAQAKNQGQDIRFSAPDGTHLNFAIERWDAAAKVADIWVRVEVVKGNFSDLFARMHWGKPDATLPAVALSPKAVFDSADGFVSVWHMGGAYPTERANSVAGGPGAIPANYDNDENSQGVIGFADSLDGLSPGDHLQFWTDYSAFNVGFTYSVWAYPTATAANSGFMDFGSGAGIDNLSFKRVGSSKDIQFEAYNGTNRSAIVAAGAIELDQWQLFTVTVAGKSAKIYKNGALIADSTLNDTLSAVPRSSNFLGRSNWAADGYFRGKLDEPILAKTARSPDWIKLCYANQNPNQNLVSFVKPPPSCDTGFSAPGDTTLPEGGSIQLSGTADCATAYQWTALAGPTARILDPEVKVLQVFLPRITADTSVQYRFTAYFGSASKTKDLTIHIRESIPDPVFTLPTNLTWTNQDSLLVAPTVTNLDLIQKSTSPDLHYVWTMSGVHADSLITGQGLVLMANTEPGDMEVRLCLDNGGIVSCDSTTIVVSHTTGMNPKPGLPRFHIPDPGPKWDAQGRRTTSPRLPSFH